MQWKFTVAARPCDYKIGEALPLILAGLPWAETLVWVSPTALLWSEVNDPRAVAEPKPAARILRQVMPLCRENEEFYRENGTVAQDLAGLVYGRGYGMLPYPQRLDIQLEARRFAAKTGETLTALLGEANCACLRTLLESKVLRAESFGHELSGEENYGAEWERVMLAQKPKDAPVLLMRREDAALWEQNGWELRPMGLALPAWPEKTPEELLAFRQSSAKGFSSCAGAMTALQKAGDGDTDALQTLGQAIKALATCQNAPAEHTLSAVMMEKAESCARLALILD